MALADIKTEDNILKAYKGESRAKGTFLAFAEKAEQEGNSGVARLFRAAAASEDVHAHALLRSLRETSKVTNDLWEAEMYDPIAVKDSAENLRTAIEEELRECTTTYPQMIQQAANDGWQLAHECFSHVRVVEQMHAALFKEALDTFGDGKDTDYYVCEFCGNTAAGEKPVGPCKVCAAPEAAFNKVH